MSEPNTPLQFMGGNYAPIPVGSFMMSSGRSNADLELFSPLIEDKGIQIPSTQKKLTMFEMKDQRGPPCFGGGATFNTCSSPLIKPSLYAPS
jgi:hypothetical protein